LESQRQDSLSSTPTWSCRRHWNRTDSSAPSFCWRSRNPPACMCPMQFLRNTRKCSRAPELRIRRGLRQQLLQDQGHHVAGVHQHRSTASDRM